VAVAEVAGSEALLKWPNDVVRDGRKVAGILVEGRPQEGWAVVGIGVNVAVREDDFPTELRATAGTLGMAPQDVEPVLDRMLEALARWVSARPEQVLDAVRARDALRGRPVRWSGGQGEAAGVDEDGRLIVVGEEGEVALEAGEVHLVRS
jgi:BirA family biotin operon repressor/biotin-[acetyl-CoA-carboxylase] ligase